MSKSVLLIGGGGTLGTHTAKELLALRCRVDILCLEEQTSDNTMLTFYQGDADEAFLTAFLENRHYDGIVNFIHYPDVAEYPPVHRLLMAHTDHLIVLSSYRVYADEVHPITETAPWLLDVSADTEFVENETYAISKAKLERYLQEECAGQPWTVVRPVISFSKLRFDVVTYNGHKMFDRMKQDGIVPLPIEAKNLTAGLDWAGNSGKLIANLLFKPHTFGESYTVSSAQNLTWGEVADLYTAAAGVKFCWVPLSEYRRVTDDFNLYALLYDRLFDRVIDNSKILAATGLTPADFTPIKEGIDIELALL